MVFLSEEEIKKSILPEPIVLKIMKEYIGGHPVAELFKAQVTCFANAMDHDSDVILIGTHDGDYNYADPKWFTKDCECLHYSAAMERFVVTKQLVERMVKVSTCDVWAGSFVKMYLYVVRNLDPMYRHRHREVLDYIANHERGYLSLKSDAVFHKTFNYMAEEILDIDHGWNGRIHIKTDWADTESGYYYDRNMWLLYYRCAVVGDLKYYPMSRDHKLEFYFDRRNDDDNKIMVKQVEQRYELDDDELTFEAFYEMLLVRDDDE